MIVYGIKNCDTVKKSTTWLKNHSIDFDFHDYKTQGITEAKLNEWIAQVGWEILVNKKGTTFKQLDDATKAKITSAAAAIELMKEKTSVIKRPVIEKAGKVMVVGFDEAKYKEVF